MSVKLVSTSDGQIFWSEGDLDAVYGIASLSKVWAAVLLHNRFCESALERSSSVDTLLDESFKVTVDYSSRIYERMAPRFDLEPPDDPFIYRPFRPEKAEFCVPVDKERVYLSRHLMEAALFQSKNDAIQAVCDHAFACDTNKVFRERSYALAEKLGLKATQIGDPHGLCDGDNVSSARDLVKFLAHSVSHHLDFFKKFDPVGKPHTAHRLINDKRLREEKTHILLAKTATGNNRQGNDTAQSMAIIAQTPVGIKIAFTLTDPHPSETLIDLLRRAP